MSTEESVLDHLSYSSLQLWAECSYAWFGHYVAGRSAQPQAPMIFGSAIDAALSASSQNKQDHGEYLQPEIAVSIFRDTFESLTPEDEGKPGLFTAALSYFWRGEDPEKMLKDGEQLLNLYFSTPWAPEDDDFLPLHSAAEIQPEGVQLRLSRPFPGDYVSEFVGVLDLLDLSGTVVDFKARKRAASWDSIDMDLQPTAYAMLLGRPITLQFIELIRGDKKASIKSHATVRTENDISWFTDYVSITAREMDTKLKALHGEFGSDPAVWDDPAALRKAANFFPPSPGRRCAFDGHFAAHCAYRAGGLPE